MAPPKLINIDLQGDVVLICGDEQGMKRSLRVSSVLLSHASPVFKVMLGPHFKEGNTLATSSRVEIPLPEDNPLAMQIICYILHLRYDDVRPQISMTSFTSLVELCDKYDIMVATRPTVQFWIEAHMKGFLGCGEAIELMQIAIKFKLWAFVKLLGAVLVKTSSMDISELPKAYAQSFTLPWHMLLQLENHRQRELRSVYTAVENEILDSVGLSTNGPSTCKERSCASTATLSMHLVEQLNDIGLWPSRVIWKKSLLQIRNDVPDLELEDVGPLKLCNENCVARQVRSTSHAGARIASKVAGIMQGLPRTIKFDPRKQGDNMVGFAS